MRGNREAPYFYRYDQDQVEEFYIRFAKEVGRSVPLLLYNIPLVTTPLQFDTAMKLIATGAYAGIKDSSGDILNFRRMLAARKRASFTLLAGADAIYAGTRAEGGDGVVLGGRCQEGIVDNRRGGWLEQQRH